MATARIPQLVRLQVKDPVVQRFIDDLIAKFNPFARLVYSGEAAAGSPPGGDAGGDLDGTYPDPVVTGLQARPVASTAPSSGDVLTWNGSAWAPATAAVSLAMVIGEVVLPDGGGAAALAHLPTTGVAIYWRGQRLTEGTDYTRTDDALSGLPTDGASILADYGWTP